MNTIIYAYELNKSFEVERLNNEIKASALPKMDSKPVIIFNRIQISFSVELTADEKTLLDSLIVSHDGSKPSRTSSLLQSKREEILSELVDMAHNHPVLKTTQDEITDYLTSIDNWFNAWKRDGNHTKLIEKIVLDSQDTTHKNYEFLNKVVNYEGNKTFEFLVSYIPTTPYI